MKKKFSININHVIWVLLIACIVLSLTGCGKQEQTVTNLTTETATEGTTTAATEDTTPVETQPAPLPTTIEKNMTIWTLDEFLDAWSVMCREDIPLPKCNITIEYLCTPVVLELGTEGVTQVQAWGRTLEVDGGFDEGYISFSINDFTDGTLYINGLENSWLVTETETFHYPYEHGIHTWFYNNGDGNPEYHKVAGAAYYMEQSETLPLDSATDRGNLYDEYGTVEMVDGAPVFTLVERTLMGDVYDFDAIFEKAIADGLEGYEGCESADDVLARNKERGIDWLTYPIDQ